MQVRVISLSNSKADVMRSGAKYRIEVGSYIQDLTEEEFGELRQSISHVLVEGDASAKP